MPEDRNTENFALGLIIAAILFLLWRREFGNKIVRRDTGAGSAARCGCDGGPQANAVNPGVSVGSESYNTLPFTASSVTPGS
jgi:hypothetical protein